MYFLSSYWFPLYVLARCLVYTSASVGPQQWVGSFIVSLVRTEGIVSLYLPSEPLKRIWVVDEIKIRTQSTVCLWYVVWHRPGQVRSECLTCTFRTSCCSARLSRARVPAFAWHSSVQLGFNVHIQSNLL